MTKKIPTDKRLVLLGTSHIASSSVEEITEYITQFSPDIVAVELDRNRLHALLENQKTSLSPKLIFRIGVTGYLFALIGGFLQKKLGKQVGVVPGQDMLSAVKMAKLHGKDIALIDQHIQKTLKNISKKFTFKEKLRLFFDVVKGFLFKKKTMSKMNSLFPTLDLTKVPEKEVIVTLINELKSRYPGLYEAIVSDRNIVMSNNLKGLLKKFPDKKILAVVGAGHVQGMEDLLKKELRLSFSTPEV